MSDDPVLDIAGIQDGADPAVTAVLACGKGGRPEPRLGNVVAVLEHDERYAGKLQWDGFNLRPLLDGRPLGELDDIQIALDLDQRYDVRVLPGMVNNAIRAVSAGNTVHGPREWLRSLTWDGVERLSNWLSTYTGAPKNALYRAYSRKFLISVVARLMKPGAKVDTVLILVGEQGIGKSTVFPSLLPEVTWFSDSALPIGSKDAYVNLVGKVLYELAELEGIDGQRSNTVKAFISSAIDNFRPPYGRVSEAIPRQGVLTGSTNDPEFLRDPTGDRRYWPVPVTRADIADLRRDAPQLWAEAVAAYDAGEQWWLTPAEDRARIQASEQYREQDPWEPMIVGWLGSGSGQFEISEILRDAIDLKVWRQNPEAALRVAKILTRLGYRKKRSTKRIGGTRPMFWCKAPRRGR